MMFTRAFVTCSIRAYASEAPAMPSAKILLSWRECWPFICPCRLFNWSIPRSLMYWVLDSVHLWCSPSARSPHVMRPCMVSCRSPRLPCSPFILGHACSSCCWLAILQKRQGTGQEPRPMMMPAERCSARGNESVSSEGQSGQH